MAEEKHNDILTAEERAELKFVSLNLKQLLYYGGVIEKRAEKIERLLSNIDDKLGVLIRK